MLELQDIQKLINDPSKCRAKIQKAIEHEDRLRFHVNVCTDTMVTNGGVLAESVPDFPYYQKFIWWVKSLGLADDKVEAFKRLLTFPLITNDVCGIIQDEYTKVFDAQDSYDEIKFDPKDIHEDFEQYEEKIENFMQRDGFRAMMSGISSIMIVDMPDIQSTPTPEPYFYLLDIRKVIALELDEQTHEIEYIVFNDCDGEIVVLDDTYYRRIIKTENDINILAENQHNLKYCPAKFFWSDCMSHTNPFLKLAPLSETLSKLDWYLFFATAKENLDITNAYPIYWSFESKCDYEDKHTGTKCVNGIVPIPSITQPGVVTPIPCPVCSKKKLTGWGSLVEKPTPRVVGDSGNVYEMAGAPVGIVSIDANALTYNRDESKRLKAEIVASATGKNDLINDQAVNQQQVSSQFETQTNVLNWIARNFEEAHKWLIDTFCTLRYGDKYKGCAMSYGTQFYLSTVDGAVKDYNDAKSSGMPNYILASKLRVIEHLQVRNNPEEKGMLRLLKALEPYPNLSNQDMITFGLDQSDKEQFAIKLNLINFVKRFEREYGDIEVFGSLLPFYKKVEQILTKFKEYVRSSESGSDTQNTGQSSTVGANNGQPGQGSEVPIPSAMGQQNSSSDVAND